MRFYTCRRQRGIDPGDVAQSGLLQRLGEGCLSPIMNRDRRGPFIMQTQLKRKTITIFQVMLDVHAQPVGSVVAGLKGNVGIKLIGYKVSAGSQMMCYRPSHLIKTGPIRGIVEQIDRQDAIEGFAEIQGRDILHMICDAERMLRLRSTATTRLAPFWRKRRA